MSTTEHTVGVGKMASVTDLAHHGFNATTLAESDRCSEAMSAGKKRMPGDGSKEHIAMIAANHSVSRYHQYEAAKARILAQRARKLKRK